MAKVCEKLILPADIERVWALITAYDNYTSWRSDLKRVDVVAGRFFMETTKDNKRLMFTITRSEPCSLLCLDMKNDVLWGSWTGRLSEDKAGTIIEIIEEVYTNKLLLRPLLKGYLKRQQAIFIEDLKRVLNKK